MQRQTCEHRAFSRRAFAALRLYAALCLALLGMAGLLWSAPKKPDHMRFARSWQLAREEAYLRDCPILVHIHDDNNTDSQLVYAMFQEDSFIKATERVVNLPIVLLSSGHPFHAVEEDGETRELSRVFGGLSKDELINISKNIDKAFKIGAPFSYPTLLCFNHAGKKQFGLVGPIKETTFKQKIEAAVGKVGNKSIVPLAEYLVYEENRDLFHRALAKKKYSAAAAACQKIRKAFKKQNRFLAKAEDLEDELNAAGLGELDAAMDIQDWEERSKLLKKIVSDFRGLDAAERAKTILKRMD